MPDIGNDRRDDWRRGVDENLASLNAGQRVWEKDLAAIRSLLANIDYLLRGNPDKETSGILGRIETLEHEISKATAVLFVDSTGKKGLVHDVNELLGRREDRRSTWGNLTKVIVAIAMSGLLGRFWQDIGAYLKRKASDPLSQMMDDDKRQTKKYHRARIPHDQD